MSWHTSGKHGAMNNRGLAAIDSIAEEREIVLRIIGIDVQSVVIDWQEETLTITDKDDGSNHTVPLDATIHVTMLGFPDRKERQMKARELGDYMERGYIIEKIVVNK